MCWSPNPQYLRMWLYLQVGSLKRWLSSTEAVKCALCLVAKPCLALCDPGDHSPPGSSVHGILQARILKCVAMSSSGGSSWPRDRTCVSCIEGRFLTHRAIKALGWALSVFTWRATLNKEVPGMCTHRERMCWNTARRQSYAAKETGFRRNQPADTLTLTLSLQNCEICCLSHAVYGILLWQP